MAQESVLRIVIDSHNAERNARNIANELQSIERNGNYATRSMDSMSVATRSLVGYMGGLVTIGAAVNKMDVWTGLQNRLKLVTDSQAELTTAMNDTFAIAQKTASSWDSAAMVYQRFADNADRLGISMKQTAVLTETVSKAISISGGSAASAEAALMQFGQALASGVLRGEEFNSIAEQAPGLLKAIAFGLDTNVGSLRAMAADGKITGDVLVESLSKAQPYIDDLFNKTDFTISQSFTRLSNEVTKFVGEAGAGSGAAAGLSDAISGLANNLGTIANIAVVGGVAFLTKAILSQTVAVYGSITASVARRAADTAVLQSQVQLAALEVQRTRQIAAQAISEIGLARQELNSATTRTARAAATMRLTQAEIAHRIALNQTTAAIATNTAAQNTLNASRAIGTRMLALVGGPIGLITLGVAGLAAGYMYLAGKTAEATAKLAEQGRVADQTAEDLKKLTGNDKKTAVTDLTAAFAAQNTELGKSKKAVDAVLFSIRASSVENEKARKVTEDAMNGTIGYTQAVALLNKMDISPDLYVMLKKQALQYDENAGKASNTQRALSLLGIEVKLVGNNAQNAVVKIDSNTEAINKNETAAQKAAKAQKAYADSLYDRDFDANFSKILLNAGKTEGEVKALLEAANYAREKGVEFTKEMANEALRVYKLENSVQDILDKRKDSEKEITKEKERQAKLGEKQYKYSSADLKMMQNVAKLSAEANLDGIGAKYGIPKNYLAGLMAQESGGNKNAVSPTGAIGYFQTTAAYRKDNGISVADSKNLPVIAEVVSKNLAKAFEKLGNWDAAIRSHNAGLAGSTQFEKTGKVDGNAARNKEVANFSPSVNKWIVGLGGSSLKTKGAANPLDDLKEYFAFLEDQAKSRKSLEFEVANEVTKIRENLKNKLIELDKAGFSPERTKELRDEFETRADNEIAIAKHALKTKLDDYGAFKKTESELLKDSFDEKKFYAAHDLELDAEGRKKAVALLDEQLKQEQGYIKLAKETQLFQAQQAYMHEVDLMQERYRLEMQEIDKIGDAKQRAAMREVTAARLIDDYEKKRKAAEDNLNQTSAQIGGFSEYYAIQKEMEDRAAVMDEARKYELISEEEHKAALIEIEKKYMDAKRSLNLSYGEQIAGSVSAMFKQQGDEQNKYYKAAITIEKSFAIARSMIAIQAGIAQAANNPWPLNLAAMASVAAQTASIVSNIKTLHVEGFATGGKISGAGTPTSDSIPIFASDKEYMVRAHAAEKLGTPTMDYINKYGELPQNTHRVGMGALNAIGSGRGSGDVVVQPQITINVPQGFTAEKSEDSNGAITIDIVRKEIKQGVKQAFSNLNNTNSFEAKQVARNFNAPFKR